MKMKFSSIVKRISLVRRWLQGKGLMWLLVAVIVMVGLPIATYGAYRLAYRNKVFPGVRVASLSVGNKTGAEVWIMLNKRVEEFGRPRLTLRWGDKNWDLDLGTIDLEYDLEKTVVEALEVGRRQSGSESLTEQWQAWARGVDVPVRTQYNQEALVSWVASISATIDKPVVNPTIKVIERVNGASGTIEVSPGESGQEVDKQLLVKLMSEGWERWGFEPVEIPVRHIEPDITQEQMERTKERAEKLLGKGLMLSTEEQVWTLKARELVSFLNFEGAFDEGKITSYTATLAKTMDRLPQNAAFRFEDGKVVEFRPGRDGLKLDQEEVISKIVTALEKLEMGEEKENKLTLLVTKTGPAISTDKVNSFGIKELLGRGISTFRGSIPPRVHNVELSAQRMSGTLVPAGETFSFNQVVGEISEATGYQQAYVIRSGRTVLGDGGGVCQTSSTLFRAVMEAGLPILERRAHSYRVGYYEQNAKPGLDATVFAPSVDFKFVNDTPAYILVQTLVDAANRKLTIEIYGTSDGRKGEMINHKIWDQTPPPPDLYQDDPSIPSGQVRQVDWSAWGSKVKFDYVVKRGGEQIYSKTFYQVYQPWQAVYLRGGGG